MARPSKTHTFTIYEDAGIPTPDSTYQPSFDDAVKARELLMGSGGCQEEEEFDSTSETEEYDTRQESLIEEYLDCGNEADNERRRESALTTTSVSSFPISAYNTDDEHDVLQHKPFTPPIIRPSFRRPESVRRMQMASPPPFGSRSPRQSILRHSRSRTGTPRSARSNGSRGSARSRLRSAEEQQQEEAKHYPLVLLHVTLLPTHLPWSMESMQELLPSHVLENLQLLRSKVSDIVLRRGILVPHPREEYEMLEERLLEALELKSEKITKCGHFRERESSASLSESVISDDPDSDSGLGSSLDGSDGERCMTCRNHIKTFKSGIGTGSKKWTVKVFAANGLMRSSAWAAAWSEMERVDVEILPWIRDEVRRKLDERREEEEAEEREAREDERERIRLVVEEEVRLAHEQQGRERVEDEASRPREEESNAPQQVAKNAAGVIVKFQQRVPTETHELLVKRPSQEFPRIYRPSQIPLSVLLRNYIFLLTQDRRNVAILLLGIIALFFALRMTSISGSAMLSAAQKDSVRYQPAISLPSAVPNDLEAALERDEEPPDDIGFLEVATAAFAIPAGEEIEFAVDTVVEDRLLLSPESSINGKATDLDPEAPTANGESDTIPHTPLHEEIVDIKG